MEKFYRRMAGSLVFAFFLITNQTVYSQNHTVTIKILDSVLLPVGNATIKVNQKAMLADSTGVITTVLPDGRYRLTVTAVGHYSSTQYITINNDTTFFVFLRSRESLLQNVISCATR